MKNNVTNYYEQRKNVNQMPENIFGR